MEETGACKCRPVSSSISRLHSCSSIELQPLQESLVLQYPGKFLTDQENFSLTWVQLQFIGPHLPITFAGHHLFRNSAELSGLDCKDRQS